MSIELYAVKSARHVFPSEWQEILSDILNSQFTKLIPSLIFYVPWILEDISVSLKSAKVDLV